MTRFQAFAFMNMVLAAHAETDMSPGAMTCGEMKTMYKALDCCGSPTKVTDFTMIPMPPTKLAGENTCYKSKEKVAAAFPNKACMVNGTLDAAEQSGINITKGYVGGLDTDAEPINFSYAHAGLCPVNVHWHLGAEHLSAGQFDDAGVGPGDLEIGDMSRRLGESVRLGLRCHLYDEMEDAFTTEYHWQHCVGMHVGETYEIHWPHSSMGACQTPNQYQSPFYDGVFCTYPDGLIESTQRSIGVQGQVFTIINDEHYFYPDLMRGMIIDGDYGADVAKYTGSTTGTSRDNEMCSSYTPITWQVDRKCHLISASSFDKMCADMKMQRADMSTDLYAHGARELVANHLAADNLERL